MREHGQTGAPQRLAQHAAAAAIEAAGHGIGAVMHDGDARTGVHGGEGELQSQHARAEDDEPPTGRDGRADALRVGEVAQGGHTGGQGVVAGDRARRAATTACARSRFGRGTPSSVGVLAREPVASTTRS